MPVRRFNLIFIAQKTGNSSGFGGDSTITHVTTPLRSGLRPCVGAGFLILLLLAVAVVIAMSILKQFQIAKNENKRKVVYWVIVRHISLAIPYFCDSKYV